MALKIREISEAGVEWLAALPDVPRSVAAKYPPDLLYRMKTGQRVVLRSYDDDGTVSVFVDRFWNPLRIFADHAVFGVDPDELTPCDDDELAAVEREAEEAAPVAGVMEAANEEFWKDLDNVPLAELMRAMSLPHSRYAPEEPEA